MLTIILIAVASILLTIGLVWLIDKFLPSGLKPVIIIALWAVIGFLGYQTFMSVYKPIQFNEVKKVRYAQVIEKLIDIRDAQLAHRQVTGKFAGDFNNLITFIDTAKYTITQRRDSTIIDVEMTKRYGGVQMTKDIVIIDTLGFVSVKDSLFKTSTRYKNMMNLPENIGPEGSKFKLEAGVIEQNDVMIPVFESSIKKDVILFDQDNDLIVQENQVIAVDGVNGDAIIVGSMNDVKTIGNWPKTYAENE